MMRTGSFVIGTLFALTIILVLLGVIMVLSASQFVFIHGSAQNIYNNNVYLYMGKQLMWLSLGLGCLSYFYTKDFNIWERYARPILMLAIILLLLVFSPLGNEVNGSRRWVPIAGFSFQPSEFAKMAVILYLAAVWADRPDRVRSITGVLFPMILVGVALGLILLEPDHSTTFFIGMVAITIWFVAGGNLLHLVPGFITMCVGVFVALYHKPVLYERVLAFLHPEQYPDKYFQVNQARVGFAHGGFWGSGIGEGQQQLGFIPYAHTDFIFSTMGEELGFLKCALVLLAFLGIILLGLWIATRCTNPFGRLLAVGCTAALGLQAMINIAVVTGSMPTTGIALPFISYGGSSLCASMSMVGMLMNIARETFDTDSSVPAERKRKQAWAEA